MYELFERYGRGIVRHRWAAVALTLVVTAAALAGMARGLASGEAVDFSPQALFADGPEAQRLAEIEADFGREDNDLLLLLLGDIGTEQGLATVRSLHEAVEACPGVDKVDSLASARVADSEGGMLVVDDLVADRTPAEAVARAQRDRFLRRLLVSDDGRLTVLRVRLDPEAAAISDVAPLVDEVLGAAHDVPLPPGFELLATGVPFIRVEVVREIMADQVRFTPIIAAVFIPMILLLFRRLWIGLAPVGAVIVAALWAVGALLGAGQQLNILSSLIPTLSMVIGISDGIHLVARYREELAHDGDREAALGRTMRHMAVACFLTTFTTAVGFASLVVTRTVVIRNFGLQSAFAVMVVWVGIMVVLPQLLAFIPPERVGPPRPQGRSAALGRLDALVAGRPLAIVVVMLLFTAAASVIASGVGPENSITEVYPPDHPTQRAVALVDERLGGVIPVFVNLEGQPDDMKRPDVVERMARAEQILADDEIVGWTGSFASQLATLHELLAGEPGMPDSPELISQELLLAEMAGLDLSRVVSEDFSQARILALSRNAGGKAYSRLQDQLQRQLDEIFADSGLKVDFTGDGLIASKGLNQLVTDMFSSVGLALVVILLTMLALFRSPRLALISAVPNLVPLVFTLATLGVIGRDLQTSNIASFTIALGLAVDDTIHFLVRYREERAAGHDLAAAISRTFQGAGRAIVLTSVLLMVGFGVMMGSRLVPSRDFGLLLFVTMGTALAGDLLMLPALLHLWGRRS